MTTPQQDSTEAVSLLEGLPDLTGAIANFAFRPADYGLASTGQEFDLMLRVQASGQVQRGVFLCRAYPFDSSSGLLEPKEASWTRSPHFNALFAYLPTFSSQDSLVSLTPFKTDTEFDVLILSVQPWQDEAVDISVEGCLLRGLSPGGQSTSYRLVPPLTDA